MNIHTHMYTYAYILARMCVYMHVSIICSEIGERMSTVTEWREHSGPLGCGTPLFRMPVLIDFLRSEREHLMSFEEWS